MFQIQSKDTVARIGHYDAVNALTNLRWDFNSNTQKIREIGNVGDVARPNQPTTTASFDMTATGSTVAFLKRMTKSFDAQGEYQGYRAGDPATANNAGIITGEDLENACFDLGIAKKPDEVFDRTELLSRVYLTSLALSASADGTATETYSVEGEVAEIYRGDFHDLLSVPGTRDAGSSTVIAVDVAYPISKDGTTDWTLYAVDINGRRVLPANVTVDNATNKLTITGDEAALGERIAVLLYRSTPGDAPAITYPTTARFFKADHINLYLVGKSTVDLDAGITDGSITDLNAVALTNSDLILRGQSASINVNFNRTPLREIRKNSTGSSIYHYAVTFPLDISASLSVHETDLALWQKITGKTSADVLDLNSFEEKYWQIVIRYFKGDTALQTTALLDATVNTRGTTLAVGGQNEVQFSFSGSKFAVGGANG